MTLRESNLLRPNPKCISLLQLFPDEAERDLLSKGGSSFFQRSFYATSDSRCGGEVLIIRRVRAGFMMMKRSEFAKDFSLSECYWGRGERSVMKGG